MYTYVQKKELMWNVTRTVTRKESTHHEVVNIVMLLATANRFLAGGGWPEFTGWPPSPHSGFPGIVKRPLSATPFTTTFLPLAFAF